ncbi:MAG TPA: nucleotidyltransferase substrate binding protein [Fibrobacteria bacterium]|nr:nucleotidyltransferase substrate binding protein [Fibrobacteria bacterium]
MAIDLDSMRKAVASLERSLRVAGGMSGMSADFRETVRAGVIQNFEVAYESSWKFIQRWLRENGQSQEADSPRTRKDLFRMAAKAGLLEDPTPWFRFGEARNLTSHTYDETHAQESFEVATSFLPYAQRLLARLEAAND